MTFSNRFSGWILAIALVIAPAAQAEDVTLNFTDADIRSVVKFVSEFSNRNFLVDNRVKGKVTIISPRAIPADDAYRVFLSILEVNGYTTVSSGEVTKIIPLAEGKQKGIGVSTGAVAGSDALITQIIPLSHANAQQVIAVLKPLVSPNSSISAYVPGNILILTDTGSNVRKIMKVVDALDVSDAVGVRMIPLEHTSAEKVAQTLQGLYGQMGGVAGKGSGPIKIVAHNPGNVLVIVAGGSMLPKIISVVAKLDVRPKKDVGRLQVRYLKNADAEDAAKVINSLIGSQKGAASKGQKTLFYGDVNIVADKATNALLITADPSDREAINALIDKLDIRRLQVLVEALIIEVSASTAQQFGIEWRGVGDFNQGGANVIGGTTFSTQAGTNINTVAANPFGGGNGLLVGVAEGTITFGGTTFANLGALLRALESQADTNVLSTPNILTMDNEEAEIIVGQNVPFITGQSSTAGGVTNPFQTIERKDVGLTLRVKPQISEGDSVRLEIYQEISGVEGGTAAEGGFITNKRAIKTVVLVSNGHIVVLGGLMRDDTTVSVQRVPCLGSIPLLGEPFKFTENIIRKTNLMVFLRPHIIKSERDIETITQGKYMDMKKLYEQPTYKGTVLFPSQKKPLPEKMNPLTPDQGQQKADTNAEAP